MFYLEFAGFFSGYRQYSQQKYMEEDATSALKSLSKYITLSSVQWNCFQYGNAHLTSLLFRVKCFSRITGDWETENQFKNGGAKWEK